MAGETSGGGGGGKVTPPRPKTSVNRPPPPKPKPIQTDVKKAASAKQAEVGVRYTPTGPKIGREDDYQRAQGMSPLAVKAITGSDEMAGKLSGRDDINKDNLGDLQTRAGAGQMADMRVGVGGLSVAANVLNTIGKKNARNIMQKIADGADPVFDSSGRIMGATSENAMGGRVYSGRPEYNPMNTGGLMGGGSNTTPAPPESAPEAPAPEDATGGTVSTAVGAAAKKKTKNLMGTDRARELMAKGLLSKTQSDRILMGG